MFRFINNPILPSSPNKVPVNASEASTSRKSFGLPVRQVSFDEEELADISQLDNSYEDYQPCSSSSRTKILSQSICSLAELELEYESVASEETPAFWHSTQARKFFGVLEDETAEEAVEDMLDLLEIAWKDTKLGEDLVQVVDGLDKYNLLTAEQRYKLYIKILYVHYALKLAKQMIDWGNKAFSFETCCAGSVDFFESIIPRKYQVKPATVQVWFRDFRHGRLFSNPKEKIHKGVAALYTFWRHRTQQCTTYLNYVVSSLRSGVVLPKGQNVYDHFYDYFLDTSLRVASKVKGYSDAEFPDRVLTDHGLSQLNSQIFHHWLADILTHVTEESHSESSDSEDNWGY